MVEIYILKSVNKIDGCQSFTHVSFLIEMKELEKPSSPCQRVCPYVPLLADF